MAAMSWRRVQVRLVTACLLASSVGALSAQSASADLVSLACGTRDVQILTLIENHGERQDVPADRLALAAFAMQVARDACRQGRTEAGMAIYDLIHPQVILAPSSLVNASPRQSQ